MYYRNIASPQRPRLDDAARDEQGISGGAVASHTFLQLWSVEGRIDSEEEQEEQHGFISSSRAALLPSCLCD